MEQEDYWEDKLRLETRYYEAKLAIEKLVAKAQMLPGVDNKAELEQLYLQVGDIFLDEIPG